MNSKLPTNEPLRSNSLDTFEPIEMLLFELYSKKPVCIEVTALRIAEHLDVTERVAPRFFAKRLDMPANPLVFQ